MGNKKYALEFEKPILELEEQLSKLYEVSQGSNLEITHEIKLLEDKIEEAKKAVYSNLNAWQRIQLARHPKRPYSLDYIQRLFEDFQELHGDRCYADDLAIVGGPAIFENQAVMLIAQQKGRDTKENIKRNFGCPNPEGYRKARRFFKMAEKFSLPIISFIDTAGAYPGVGSEERHIAEAIAVNILEMSQLKVPILSIIIGEGGSGGALGIAVADKVLILENAYYSVISPEGCASILWKDRAFAPQAAEALKITAPQLLELGIVDEVIGEPLGGAHMNADETANSIKVSIRNHLSYLIKQEINTLLNMRYSKYRKMGVWKEQKE